MASAFDAAGSCGRPGACTPSPAETAVDHGFGALPVVRAEHARVHDRLRGGVEHLVLELSPAELGPDEVPDELQELHALAGAHRRPAHELLEIGARLRTVEPRLR